MNAWLFQDHRQKQRLGDKCPWSVGYIDPEGKRKSKKIGSKSAAEKFARRTEGQLAAGTYEANSRKKWADFRKEYEDKGMPGAAAGTRDVSERALDHFERIIKPVRMCAITTRTIADYVAVRRLETFRRGKAASGDTCNNDKTDQAGATIATPTINKELRHVRAAIRRAHKWGYLAKLPEFEFLREPGKLPTYVSPADFANIYKAADSAHWPADGHYNAADWWRALIVMAMMTGWRIGSLMALRWVDVDLEGGFAVSRAADNKGKRDQRVPLHPVVVEHLKKLVCFSVTVFAWDYGRRALYQEFDTIQQAAKVKPEGTKTRYGFHDFRRAFATMNAGTMTADALQALMQHRSYATTQRYINLSRQLSPAVQNLFVPEMPKAGTA